MRIMSEPESPSPPSIPPLKGSDRTREQILDAAGAVFAAKGYDGATSREICDRAGVNTAAVNYHFGGIDALYAATLLQAHRRFLKIETLAAIAASNADARSKLRAFLASMVQRLLQPLAASWELRLLGREIASPTKARDALVETEILPKHRLLRQLIADVLGVKTDHPAVSRALLNVIAPCMLLALADRRALELIMPNLADPAREIGPLTDHVERFILAGLDAISLDCHDQPKD